MGSPFLCRVALAPFVAKMPIIKKNEFFLKKVRNLFGGVAEKLYLCNVKIKEDALRVIIEILERWQSGRLHRS